MKISTALVAAIGLCTGIYGQTHLEFEVASIRPTVSNGPADQVTAGVHIDGAQVRCTSLTLKEYIGMAYRLKANQVSGPDWISGDRYDISAKLPDGSTTEQMPEMMKTLLTERFQITSHTEMKDLPVYVLEVAKGGIRAKESPVESASQDPDADKSGVNIAGGGSRNGISVNLGHGAYYSFANNKFEANKLTLTQAAAILETFLDRPVVDKTDLKNAYDFTLDLTEDDYRVMLIRAGLHAGITMSPQAMRLLDLPWGDSFNAALQKVGLTMTPKKSPIEMLIVDQAKKAPTEN